MISVDLLSIIKKPILSLLPPPTPTTTPIHHPHPPPKESKVSVTMKVFKKEIMNFLHVVPI